MSIAHLEYDPVEAVRALKAGDERLAQAIEQVGPFRIRPRSGDTPFEALMRSIVYQQLSGKAAATIHGRLLDVLEDPTPKCVLVLPNEALRGAGLSRAKTAAVQDLAAKTLEGIVPDLATLSKLEDEVVIERLTQVRGIGPWTVQMFLMFYLGRPDVLPATDLGVQKGVMQVYDLSEKPTPKQVLVRGERWRPYRTVASWYLWRVLDQP